MMMLRNAYVDLRTSQVPFFVLKHIFLSAAYFIN